MSALEYTPVQDVEQLYTTVKSTFLSGKTRPIAWRKQQIRQLGLLVAENEPAFIKALESDLSRPAFETLTGEITPLKGEIAEAYNHVGKWAKPVKVKTDLLWAFAKASVYPEPKGVALVIGTWNYPITLLLCPLLGAITAGCSAIVKPAEQAPAVATLIASLIPKYLDTSAYKVVNGAIDQTTALLKHRFDAIFYTGSGNVGRIIAKAAAEHLTPCTLELGGKSPAVVFDDANIKIIAKRIMWGKYANSGQICIAPDYVLCSKEMQPKLIEAFRAALKEFQPTGSLTDSDTFCKIITPQHFARISKLIDSTKGNIVIGGSKNEAKNKIEVTVVADVKPDDALMEGEIFGPLLPIVVLESKEEIVEFIKARDNPLALYVFTQDTANRDYVFNNTRSGTFVQNDVLVQFAIPGLPFGGAGPSGYGNYHGKRSFDTFSQERSSASIPTWLEVGLAARYPPYTAKNLKMMLMVGKKKLGGGGSSFGGLKFILSVAAILTAVIAGYKRSVGP